LACLGIGHSGELYDIGPEVFRKGEGLFYRAVMIL